MNVEGPRQYREEELRTALATDPRVSEPELSVEIAADRVIVRGVVPTEERRAQVALVIDELAPDLGFADEMEVASGYPKPQDGEVAP
jgi:hypothetical protein